MVSRKLSSGSLPFFLLIRISILGGMSKENSHNNLSNEDIEDLKSRREDLLREIEEYNREREQIKATLGNIGGEKYQKTDKIMNIAFLSLIVLLFTVEITTEFIPTFISLELSVL